MTLRRARRVFLALTVTRWLPVGFVLGVFPLLALDRGLSLAEVGLYSSAQGIMVVLFELPTSGFADAFGRKPVLVVAGLVNVITVGAYVLAQSFVGFAVAAALMGIYRALDSGPLEAWFVDAVHEVTPGADVDGELARQNALLGSTLAFGAATSGALIAWHPVRSASALDLPVQISLVLACLHLAMTATLLRETPRGGGSRWQVAARSVRAAPATVRSGLGLLRTNAALRGIVSVEAFWMFAMVVFEFFMPIRLSEMLGSPAAAGSWVGPTAALGWCAFAVGSHVAGVVTPRCGIARTAMLSRVLNGVGAAVMGVMTGPVGLATAYLVTYGLHASAGTAHSALLHREATADNRATVLSVNSMVAFLAGALVQPVLAMAAARTSSQSVMIAAGLVSVIGFLGYRPALQAEARRATRQSG